MMKSPFKKSLGLKIALLLSKIVTLNSGTGFSLNRKYFLRQKSRHATRNRTTISVAEPNLHYGHKIAPRFPISNTYRISVFHTPSYPILPQNSIKMSK